MSRATCPDPTPCRSAIDATVKAVRAAGHRVRQRGHQRRAGRRIEELKPEEWDKTIDINLKGTYLTLHFAIPHLKQAGGGSILITSSVNGNRVFTSAGATAYSTSKAGQVAMMKMAAVELGRYNIRVNAVCPGAIHTNIDQRTEKRDTEKIDAKVEMRGRQSRRCTTGRASRLTWPIRACSSPATCRATCPAWRSTWTAARPC